MHPRDQAQHPENSHVDSVPCSMMQWEHRVTLTVFLCKPHNLSISMRKNQRNSSEGQSTKCLTSTSQNHQDGQKQGKSKKLSLLRGT
jgi:hypothetical protein